MKQVLVKHVWLPAGQVTTVQTDAARTQTEPGPRLPASPPRQVSPPRLTCGSVGSARRSPVTGRRVKLIQNGSKPNVNGGAYRLLTGLLPHVFSHNATVPWTSYVPAPFGLRQAKWDKRNKTRFNTTGPSLICNHLKKIYIYITTRFGYLKLLSNVVIDEIDPKYY